MLRFRGSARKSTDKSRISVEIGRWGRGAVEYDVRARRGAPVTGDAAAIRTQTYVLEYKGALGVR